MTIKLYIIIDREDLCLTNSIIAFLNKSQENFRDSFISV